MLVYVAVRVRLATTPKVCRFVMLRRSFVSDGLRYLACDKEDDYHAAYASYIGIARPSGSCSRFRDNRLWFPSGHGSVSRFNFGTGHRAGGHTNQAHTAERDHVLP